MVKIFCVNTQTTHLLSQGLMIPELVQKIGYKGKYPVIGALVNNRLKGTDYRTYTPKNITLVDVSSSEGYRIYTASLQFLLYKAVRDLYPLVEIKIEHSLSKGVYVEVKGLEEMLSQEWIDKVEGYMRKLVEENIPFVRKKIPSEDAVHAYQGIGESEKISLIQSREKLYSTAYYLGNTLNNFYTPLVPSTKNLSVFGLEFFDDKGFFLIFPNKKDPGTLNKKETSHPKLFNIFREHQRWIDVLGIPYVSQLNETVLGKNKINELIQVSEALHEKKYAIIADQIASKGDEIKAVLIAGPSSSGKTTSCRRISTQLSVLGYAPIQLSLDNYFLNREDTPKDEHGEYDFEAFEALDIPLFNEHLSLLFQGKELEIPTFDFLTGKRVYRGDFIRMQQNSILIIEGIHGLNPNLIPSVDKKHTFGVFVSALTQVSLDRHNRISSTDNRLIRRIVRDFNYRGYSALDTLKRWPSVHAGEGKHIFPFQENADIIFNSALLYELGVLKTFAEPLLQQVSEKNREHAEAIRLLEFLSYFQSIRPDIIPPTSIMREFLGGSSFVY